MPLSTAPFESPRRDNPAPMYHQIRLYLEEQMRLGALPLGAQVPSEQSLCTLHRVSRITARRALEDLREAGIIERAQGRGSFVCRLPEGPPSPPATQAEIGILTNYASENISSNDDSWSAHIIRALESQLAQKEFHVTLLSLPQSDYKFWERIDALGSRLAGVLGFAMPTVSPELFQELDRRSLPWVTVNPFNREQTHNFVSANNFAGGWRVAQECARQDYRTALFVSTDIRFISNADRFFGFQQGWFEAGGRLEDMRRFEVASVASFNEEESAGLAQLLTAKDRPCAVFCAGDLLASSVLKICQQYGLAVPGDVAVIGGTGIMLAEHTTPTLTVLAQPMAELGRIAATMLIEMIRTKQFRIPGRYVPCPLIRRSSCPIGNTL